MHIKFGVDRFVFTKANLPTLEDSNINLSSITITKKWHCYNDSYRIEMLDFSMNKFHHSLIGLLILESLFYRKSIVIKIDNDNSEIKFIRIGDDFDYFEKKFGLIQENKAYNYWPSELRHRYPLIDLTEFPNFNLLHFDEKSCITEEDWNTRNCLQISGSDNVMATLAELFLNIGHNDNTLDEIVLESAVGYGGVSHGSVELRFWLPGSIGYNEN